MKNSVLILTIILQLSLPILAQQQPGSPQERPAAKPQEPIRPSDEDVVRITTNLVQVDAVVTGKNGKQVTDLRPEELEIFEDGKPQQITNFSYVSLESAAPLLPTGPVEKSIDKYGPPVPPVHLRPEQVHRTIALVVDDLTMSFESIYFVHEALKKFLDQQMQPDDLVAIIRTGGGIGALQQFTSDKRQLYAAVERVKWDLRGSGGVSAFAPFAADPLDSLDLGQARNSTERVSERESGADFDQFREDLFTVGTLGALNYIVRGLRELPGRKSVILISDGIKIFSRSDLSRGSRILMVMRRLTDLANRASVVIYTMDARGLQVPGLTAADSTFGMSSEQLEQRLNNRWTDMFESQDGLNYLAQQTSGLAIRNANDLNGGIRRVLDDQKGYYLIGYRPDEATFETVSGRRKFHKLRLQIKRSGNFNVRMRNGFLGITDEEAVPVRKTRAQQLIGALTSPFSSAGVQVRLTSLFANDAKAGSVMRSFMHVSGKDLTFMDEADGWHKAVFDIVAITFGDNGTVVDQIERTHTMRVKGKTYERVLNSGFTYNLTVPIKKPGAYQLRTALRDELSERVGSATQFVEVPDIKKNRLVVSGIVVRGTSPEALKRTASKPANQQDNSDDSAEEFDPVASTAVRQFGRGFVVEYGFAIYNAQLEKATEKPKLQTQARLFRNGQKVFTGKEISLDPGNQPDLKRLLVSGALQLGREMIPGDYVLQIIVTDLLAKEKRRIATQWIDFEITK